MIAFLDRAAPLIFVVIWATGFVVARLVAPHAEPLTFLSVRFAATIGILAPAALVVGARWPTGSRQWRDALIAGVLLQGVYLGGVFWSVRHGLSAGISSLVVGLQPLLTAMLAGPLIGEKVSGRRWLGILIGFVGAALVLAPRLGDGIAPLPLAVCTLAMMGITLGTLWQKRTAADVDLRTNAVVQFMGALAVTLPLALLLEEGQFDFSGELIFGLAWAVFGMSIGAIALLLHLIRHGAVAGVAALLYLVPPISAAMAYVIFGETLTLVQTAGMLVAAIGVALAGRP
jgi:drug/metabolite transporter (DMT)-like permease